MARANVDLTSGLNQISTTIGSYPILAYRCSTVPFYYVGNGPFRLFSSRGGYSV